ncbi:PBSX family phage terminase large subunit [soil metagenome]
MPHDSAIKKAPEQVFDFSNLELYNPVYVPTFQRRESCLHYFGSAGSGKSVFVAQKEIVLSFQPWRKGRKTLVARRYYNSLGQSCFSQLKNIIYTWGLADCFKFGTSPYYIRNLKTGVEFVFLGLDDVEKIKSIHGADRGWVEEATEMRSMDDLNLLRDRLRGYRFTQWTLSYNPTDAEHFINKEIHIPQLAGHYIKKTTYKDNIKLLEVDPGYADRLEAYKETNPNHYRVYAQGMWGKRLEGLVYPDYVDAPELPCPPHAYGLDLGWNDPIAMCKLALVDEYGKARKQLYVEEAIYESKMDIPAFIARCSEIKISKNIPIVYDTAGSGPLFADALRQAGYWVIPAEKGEGSVKAGIANVKAFDLRPVGGGKNLFAEFNAYSWELKNGIWQEMPAKGLDHLCDAMRYAVWHLAKPIGSGDEYEEEWY